MTACPLTVIPPNCTDVPITQLEKIILCTKVFCFNQKKLKYFWYLKNRFQFQFQYLKIYVIKMLCYKMFFIINLF
jgi:hypothetical protein